MTLLNQPITMDLNQAIREACDILGEESNQIIHAGMDKRTFKQLPHRVQIAVAREMARLRLIETTLRKQLPVLPCMEEEERAI